MMVVMMIMLLKIMVVVVMITVEKEGAHDGGDGNAYGGIGD